MKKYILLAISIFILSLNAVAKAEPELISSLNSSEETDITEITDVESSEHNDLIEYNKKIGVELVKAIDNKKLVVSQEIEIYLVQISMDGYCILKERKKDSEGNESFINHKTYGSKELMNLLFELVNADDINQDKPLIILSLFRIGGSRNHGELKDNGDIVGRAVDICSYAGYKINIEEPQSALQGITKILYRLPTSRYNIGLPRPTSEKELIKPEMDYFLPVTDIKQSRVSPTGTIVGDLSRIKNEEAKIELTETIISNKNAEILYLFPDAPDHIHIKALEKGKMQ